jgi:hypothetical protein
MALRRFRIAFNSQSKATFPNCGCVPLGLRCDLRVRHLAQHRILFRGERSTADHCGSDMRWAWNASVAAIFAKLL